MKQNITAIVLTKNEEKNIGRCLGSIKNHVKRLVVVDSGSTDNTLEIAKDERGDLYIKSSLEMTDRPEHIINDPYDIVKIL